MKDDIRDQSWGRKGQLELFELVRGFNQQAAIARGVSSVTVAGVIQMIWSLPQEMRESVVVRAVALRSYTIVAMLKLWSWRTLRPSGNDALCPNDLGNKLRWKGRGFTAERIR